MSIKKPTVGTLEFKADGDIQIVQSKNVRGVTPKDLVAFELSARYLLYAMNRLDWMYEFIEEAEKHGIDINPIVESMGSNPKESSPLGTKKPSLRVIKGGKKSEEEPPEKN